MKNYAGWEIKNCFLNFVVCCCSPIQLFISLPKSCNSTLLMKPTAKLIEKVVSIFTEGGNCRSRFVILTLNSLNNLHVMMLYFDLA